jgi:carbamoyl-phosphate synthase small subunit
MAETKAYLILENGLCLEGTAFGAEKESTGEVVFTTAMTGYIETLTDKSYYGQIITQTFPLIGNYGIIPEDFEGSKICASGYIVGEACASPSNFRCGGTLDAFLREQGIPGIYGIDTRRLTRLLRARGTMNGRISFTPAFRPELADFRITDAVKNVSVTKPIPGRGGCYKVAMIDYGYKENIRRELEQRDCSVTIFPYDTSAEDIIGFAPDGIMLSNGPGDPKDNPVSIANLRKLFENTDIPILGICLGHQLLALAAGFSTEKLKFGHRGANQPSKDVATGRTYITTQNHGYTVKDDSIDLEMAQVRFINMNDGTIEGLQYKRKGTFTVQFHPEGCGGPRDTAFLFDEFVKLMGEYKSAER